jgi:hypothetical protein
MDSSVCKWIVGKGCKKASTRSSPPPPPPIESDIPPPPPDSFLSPQLGADIIKFLDNENIQFENLGSCLKDIVIDKYLARGSYGSVYAIRYKGQERVMKIVVSKAIPGQKIRKTKMTDATLEAKVLRKASKLNVGPKLYDFRICNVTLPYYFKDAKIKIGVFILEKLDYTLNDYLKDMAKHLNEVGEDEKYKLYSQYESNVRKIAKKIEKDCLIAKEDGLHIFDIHGGNIMFRGNTPIINDWGMTTKEYIGECDQIEFIFLVSFQKFVEDYAKGKYK